MYSSISAEIRNITLLRGILALELFNASEIVPSRCQGVLLTVSQLEVNELLVKNVRGGFSYLTGVSSFKRRLLGANRKWRNSSPVSNRQLSYLPSEASPVTETTQSGQPRPSPVLTRVSRVPLCRLLRCCQPATDKGWKRLVAGHSSPIRVIRVTYVK